MWNTAQPEDTQAQTIVTFGAFSGIQRKKERKQGQALPCSPSFSLSTQALLVAQGLQRHQ